MDIKSTFRCCSVSAFWLILGTCVFGTAQSWCDDTANKTETSQRPLTENERDDFLGRVTTNWMGSEQIMSQSLVKEYANRLIIPCLQQVIEDEKRPLNARLQAMCVLGETRDPHGIPIFRTIIDKPLKENMSDDEYCLFRGAILNLGHLADEANLDLLFKMITDDYWLARAPQACLKNGTSKGFRGLMRLDALGGISYSGSERAIKAFTTNEGIPEDLQKASASMLGGAKYNQKTRNEQEKK